MLQSHACQNRMLLLIASSAVLGQERGETGFPLSLHPQAGMMLRRPWSTVITGDCASKRGVAAGGQWPGYGCLQGVWST